MRWLGAEDSVLMNRHDPGQAYLFQRRAGTGRVEGAG